MGLECIFVCFGFMDHRKLYRSSRNLVIKKKNEQFFPLRLSVRFGFLYSFLDEQNNSYSQSYITYNHSLLFVNRKSTLKILCTIFVNTTKRFFLVVYLQTRATVNNGL